LANKFKALSRQEHIKSIKLAAYSTPYPENSDDENRKIVETTCDSRNAFIRDRDRIVHSESFRRLQGKTQVYVSELSPIIRNRLTHTMEVWQISVSIARMLRANIHLTEAIAFGHDLGHTPFGHAGENALDNIMIESGLDGFSHNEQSVRVVSLLESKPNITLASGQKIDSKSKSVGLNLTYATREGIFKHTDRFKNDCKNKRMYNEYKGFSDGSIEAQIVNISDEIAQRTHDLQDVWMTGAIAREDIALIFSMSPDFFGDESFGIEKAGISSIVGNLINDVVNASLNNLNDSFDGDPRKKRFITYSEDGAIFSSQLEKLIKKAAILGDEVNQMNSRGRHIIHSLYDISLKDPYCVPNFIKDKFRLELRKKLNDPKGYEKISIKHNKDKRVICDYIASLTDKEAIDIFRSTLI